MKNLSSLEILRGLAAVAVMLFHFSQEKYGAPSTWRNIFINGQLGVHVFFVISGFVIPLQLARRNYTLKNFPEFLLNRFIRIYPCFFLVSAIAATVWFIQYQFMGGSHSPDLTIENIIKNMSLTANMLGGQYYVNVSWTLAIEFMYYVVLGISFFWIFSSRSWVRVASYAFLFSLYFLLPFSNSWSFFEWVPFFMIGFMLYRIKASFWSLEAALLLLLSFTFIIFRAGFLPPINQLIATFFVCLIVVFAPDLKQKHLAFLGKISYSLYLIHNVIGSKVFKFIEITGGREKLGYFSSLFIAAMLSILSAYILYKFVEIPSHILSKKAWRKNHKSNNALDSNG